MAVSAVPVYSAIKIDLPREQGLLANESAAKIEPAIGMQRGVRFDLLREQFAQDDLLGEIFRSDDDGVGRLRRQPARLPERSRRVAGHSGDLVR